MPIVEAVGVSSATLDPNKVALSKEIEAAMSKAVLDSIAKGITDPVLMKAEIMKAREDVIGLYS